MAKLSPIERAKLKKIFADPVLWAKAFVRTYDAGTKKHGPWTARSYQEEMLRDFSLRKVYRLGRRCVPGWAVIFDPTTGELITAEELFERKKSFNVVSLNSEYRATAKQNSVINESGEREVLRVTLESGKVIDATADHPLLTAFGWRNIEELNVGDSIGTPLALNFFGNQEIDDNDAKFLAYMIGDGNCTRKTIRFTQAPGKQLEEMKQIVSQYGCELHHYECSENPYDYSIRKKEHRLNKTYKNGARELLIKYDVFGHGADDKFIPKEIFRSSKRQIALFISRLFSTDGWACSSDKKTRTEIGYCSNSERLIRELAHLLLRFGIRTHIRKKKKAWILCICDRISFMIFKEEIGIYGKEEAVSKCFDIITQGKEQDLFMPKEINPVIQKEISRRGLKLTNLVKLWSSDPLNERLRLKSYKLQKWKARILSKYLGLREIVKLCDGDIEWDPVKSIEHLGKFMTYSVMVPENNNFVVNDVYTHNCGKSETMIIEGLWRAMTAPKGRNYRVLYVTPYENQVNLLFMRMRELIAESPLLKNEITRIKSSPYTVEFKNGSTILGFTTGASSGQGAASVRGQRADWLFLDEIDYMGENDYSTVAMIAGERPDIGMTCSSTPTGKRGVFYQMCTDKRPNGMGYSEHYHPSMDNPNWSQQLEDQYRAELTASQYDHEILAIFGTEEAGVFDKNKLDEAMRQVYYTYAPLTETQKRNLNGQQPPIEIMYDEENLAPYNPFRCIGIDWDAYQAGSSLLVLDFDVHRKKFMVMKRIEVPRSEYSLDKAVQMTVKLNQIYRPSWIFCDRGYGDYQLERLHIYGDQHPESGLKSKVIGYQFKQTLDILDPITRRKTKEPMKQFMVNQLKLNFERGRIILSPFDEVLHKQLVDYEVDHISQSGVPVYTSKNEHFVDALGLAHLAFVLKFPDLTGAIKTMKTETRIQQVHADPLNRQANAALRDLDNSINPWKNTSRVKQIGKDPDELPGDYQKWVHVPLTSSGGRSYHSSWGSRSGRNSGGGRTMW